MRGINNSRRVKTTHALLIVIAVLLGLFFFLFYSSIFGESKLNPSLQRETVIANLSSLTTLKAKILDSYYMISNDELLDLLSAIEWNGQTELADTSSDWITLRLGEKYEVYIYDDGILSVYYGWRDLTPKAREDYAQSRSRLTHWPQAYR
jgi:hypothetical protein